MKKVIMAILAAVLLIGCTKTIYVDRPVTQTEYIEKVRVDSLVLHDSVYVSEKQKNDTIFITKYEIHYKDRIVESVDTVIKTDSIAYPVEVEKIVTEYRTRGIVKLFAWLGLACLLAMAGWAAWKFYFKNKIPVK